MRRTVVALFFFALLGCSDEVTTEVELSGLVLDLETGAPIEGAAVTFRSDVLETASATTDSDGHYEMTILTQVALGHVRAEAGGYQAAQRSVFFDTPTRRIDLSLRSDGSGD
jgi:uncharacterized protein YfaS (alpha-2-macroglobulin family)